MSNELKEYKVDDTSIKIPRHWVPIHELQEIAEDMGFGPISNFDAFLHELGIETKKDMADFNNVNLSLTGQGLIELDFFKKILDHNFNDDHIHILDLFNLLHSLMDSAKKHKLEDEKETQMIISALKELVDYNS